MIVKLELHCILCGVKKIYIPTAYCKVCSINCCYCVTVEMTGIPHHSQIVKNIYICINLKLYVTKVSGGFTVFYSNVSKMLN